MSTPLQARRSRRFPVAAVVLALLVGAAALVFAAPALFGVQRSMLIAQVIAFRAPVVLGAAGLLVLVLILMSVSRGARRLLGLTSLVLVAFIAVSLVIIGSRGIGPEHVPGASSDQDVRVLTWNTRGDEPGSPGIAALAVELDVDVVVLPETTETLGVEIATQMAEAGAPMWVHTRTFDEEFRATSTTLLLSPALGEYAVDTSVGDTSTLPTVVATPLDGAGPTIVAAHPVSPTPGNMEAWRSDLEWLADRCTGDAIVAGDLNATLDHLHGLTDDGTGLDDAAFDLGACHDGAHATGNAALGTWTTGLSPLLGAPIDHVMATANWRFTGFAVILTEDRTGSDHRPVFAQLSPA